MPVRKLRSDSNPRDLAQTLADQHPRMLSPSIVSSEQLERLVSRLVSHRQSLDARKRESQASQRQEPLVESDEEADDFAPPSPPTQTTTSASNLGNEAVPPRSRRIPIPEDALSSLSTRPGASLPRKPPPPEDDALASLLSLPSSRAHPPKGGENLPSKSSSLPSDTEAVDPSPFSAAGGMGSSSDLPSAPPLAARGGGAGVERPASEGSLELEELSDDDKRQPSLQPDEDLNK
ncbi:MAG: hypothetical protein SGPRY_005035, partial [Prymnesium sp.]